MSLFDKNLADKPVKDRIFIMMNIPSGEYWFDPKGFKYEANYEYGKPHTQFTNDKKQKNFRKYASRSVNWKSGRIR